MRFGSSYTQKRIIKPYTNMSIQMFLESVYKGLSSELEIKEALIKHSKNGELQSSISLKSHINSILDELEGIFLTHLEDDWIDWQMHEEVYLERFRETEDPQVSNLKSEDFPKTFEELASNSFANELSTNLRHLIKREYLRADHKSIIPATIEEFFREYIPAIALLSTSTRKALIELSLAKTRFIYVDSKLDELMNNNSQEIVPLNSYMANEKAQELFIELLVINYSFSNMSFFCHLMREDKLLKNARRFDRSFMDSLANLISQKLNMGEDFYIDRIAGLAAIKSQNKLRVRYETLRNQKGLNPAT